MSEGRNGRTTTGAGGTEPRGPYRGARPGSLRNSRGRGRSAQKVSDEPFFVEGAKIATAKGEVNPSQQTLAWAIGGEWRAVSNMESTTFPASTTKEKALEMLRDFGIKEAYDTSRPLSGFQIFYQDPDDKGTLPSAVLNAESSALVPSLGK